MLVEELKEELQITILEDEDGRRLQRYLDEGIHFLSDIAGFKVEGDSPSVKPLLFAYCRYAYYHSLEHFQTNFHHDLVTFRWKVARDNYDSKSEASEV